MRSKLSLSFGDAQLVVAACMDAAKGYDSAVSIAVVDEAGSLLHFARMDGARAYTVDLASQKAKTSASVGVPTSVIEALYKDRPAPSNTPIAGRGGVPVQHDGQCVGAVGISGAKPDVDEIIAQRGISALSL